MQHSTKARNSLERERRRSFSIGIYKPPDAMLSHSVFQRASWLSLSAQQLRCLSPSFPVTRLALNFPAGKYTQAGASSSNIVIQFVFIELLSLVLLFGDLAV